MECRTCRMKRPAEMFRARANRPGQRETQCQECRAAHKRAARQAAAHAEGRRFICKGGRRWAPDPVKAPKPSPMPSPSALARAAWKEWMDWRAPQWWLDAYRARTAQRGRDRARLKWRRRYSNDPAFAAGQRLRLQQRRALRGRYGDRIRLWLKGRGTASGLAMEFGYSLDQLRLHLERQFHGGMTWDAFFRGEIHIDHRLPLRMFNLNDESEWRAAWALTNLQPMWAKDNLSKAGRREVLL